MPGIRGADRAPRAAGRDPDEVARWSSRYALRLLEHAGHRPGVRRRAAAERDVRVGDRPLERVRGARHGAQLRQQVLLEVGRRRRAALREPYHNAEFEFLQSAAQHELKIPITGAYTLAVWSYDEHYAPAAGASGQGPIAPARSLLGGSSRRPCPGRDPPEPPGADRAGRDVDPDRRAGASTEQDELEVFVESFNASVEGLDCVFSTHSASPTTSCSSRRSRAMGGCKQYCVGFANYDTRELGTSSAERPGYEVISRFRDLPYEPSLASACSTSTRTSSSRPSSCATASSMRSTSSATRPDSGLPRLRPAHPQLGRRLREAREHGGGHTARRRGAQPRIRRGRLAAATSGLRRYPQGC